MGERTHIGGPLAAALITALAAAALVGGIATWYVATTPADPPRESVTDLREFQQLAVEHPNRALARCDRSQPTLFAGLAAQLADDTDSFSGDRFEYRKGGLTYLSANLLNDNGDIKASTPVWIYGGGGYAALSQSADRASVLLPDAQEAYQANPYGQAATRVKTCVIAAGRAGQ